jgi:thiol-disulfide isomerase/thioredoxin
MKWLLSILFFLFTSPVIAQPGKQYNLAVLPKEKRAHLYVYVMLSPDCPLCKNYGPVLQSMKERYASQVAFAGVVPGKTYSRKVIADYQKDYGISFPVYADRDKRISKQLEATITPEVVLLNEQGKLLYRGSVDNWATSLGKKRSAASKHYLDDAITQSIAGQPVTTSYVAPLGCFIDDY